MTKSMGELNKFKSVMNTLFYKANYVVLFTASSRYSGLQENAVHEKGFANRWFTYIIELNKVLI